MSLEGTQALENSDSAFANHDLMKLFKLTNRLQGKT